MDIETEFPNAVIVAAVLAELAFTELVTVSMLDKL